MPGRTPATQKLIDFISQNKPTMKEFLAFWNNMPEEERKQHSDSLRGHTPWTTCFTENSNEIMVEVNPEELYDMEYTYERGPNV